MNMKTIKTFNEWLNEGYIPPERSHVYSLTHDQLQSELRKYVEDYYKEFPEKFEEDQENGSSSINWGELESPEYIVANYVADLLVTADFEEEDLSKKDKEIVDLAWAIADYYLENGFSEGNEDEDESVSSENAPEIEGTLKDLYDYLIKSYECLGKEEIELNKGKTDGKWWYEIKVPVTLSGLYFDTEPGDSADVFSVDIQPELEQYLEPDTYVEIDDQILDEYGVLRIFTESDGVSNSDIIKILDGLLKNVPDPALRKK